MSYLIVTDIDHTLLNHAGELVEKNVTALQKAQERGATVVLATARSYAGALVIHEALNLSTPLIVSNGTLVCEANGKVMMVETLNVATAQHVVETFSATVHHWNFRTTEAAFLHPEFDRSRHPFNDPHHYRPTSLEHLPQVMGNYDRLITATVFGHELSSLHEQDWSGLELTVDYYPPSHYTSKEAVSVMSNKASKGNAVRWLRGYLNLNNTPTLCLGDSAADATMFDLGDSSLGVAPANAAESVKEKAHWVAPHCNDGAVAAAVEKFVLPVSIL
jgi:Cof subfamily protein (haloacid dehalogenase superfamily)